jgi:alkylation response protein AidB-like acyl-CoA dehydrogenase
VDFELSDDQQALGAAARELLADHASTTRVRAVVDAGGGRDPELWSAMVEQGWTALAVPEELGGLGLGWVELAVLFEQVGAYLAPVPFVQHALAAEALARAGSERAAAVIGGDEIAAVAFRPVRARRRGDGWIVDGDVGPVVYAPSASVVVVRSDTDLFAVGTGDLGTGDLGTGDHCVAIERQTAMDLTRELGSMRFTDAPAERLGGGDAVERFLDSGATAYAAEMLGIAGRSLDLAVAYAKQREQFGRPIGSFQAVKHRCADMLVDVEGMRSAVFYAAWCLAADDPDRSVASSMAKTWCSDAAHRVTASCLQVHGGVGFTWESDVHLFLKRSQLDEVSFGDAVFHRARLARLLRARVDAGERVI